jgi:tRNA-specific 2-thiouridylase
MLNSRKKLVVVGMSGGVDSSVAAYLLKEQGYDVLGVFMRCYNLHGCAERDAEDARRAAGHIGIPFYVWDFEEEYKKRIVEYMVEGYRAGITPNPDVMCNREIKFGLFLERALAMGADHVATGHYVKIKKARRGYALFAAKDKNKDQSYFLWTLTQTELKYCLFPIGDYLKPDVRAIARRAKLPTADKKDSQGICFLGAVDILDFLKKYIPQHRGAIVTVEGEDIGEHSGSEFYTIGQRHLVGADFKFPKTHGAVPRRPFYVAAKDAATNTVVVAEGGDHPSLYKKEVRLMGVNSANSLCAHLTESKSRGIPVFARVRYRQPLAKAVLFMRPRGKAKLVFVKPQKFIAPGQSAVWHSKNGEMLGGGVILSAR